MEQTIYLYKALARKKENPEITKTKCINYLTNSPDKALEFFQKTIDSKYIWRMYRSVNKRSTIKAKKMLMTYLINNNDLDHRIDLLWYRMLARPQSAGERKFLLDVDTKNFEGLKDIYNQVIKIFPSLKGIELIETPNGMHIVTPPFRPSELQNPSVTIVRDNLIFITLLNRGLNDT